MLAGRAREMGLGSIALLSLANARSAAHDCRKLLHQGIDPIEARKAQRQQQRLADAKSKTFEECATAYIGAHEAGWRNAKHADQWRSTLKTYVYPTMGNLSIQGIDTDLVKKVLEPIWNTKTETASRIRGRIEAVLDWATASNYRQGDNPARWRGHLDHLLPTRSAVQEVVHHSAHPYSQIADFMADLSKEEGVGARGLEFLILTAARTGEVIGARWEEFDEDMNLWTIPKNRMKIKTKDHRVPMSAAAKTVLSEMQKISQSEFVFPGQRVAKSLSNMALLQLLKRMKRGDITSHGFRSTFKDWATEQTDFSRDVVEMALAHTIGNKVEAAYRRGDLFEKRTLLMKAWAQYCTGAQSPPASESATSSEQLASA